MNVSYLRKVVETTTPNFNEVGSVKSLSPLQEKTKIIAMIALACVAAILCGIYWYYSSRVSRLKSKANTLVSQGNFDAAKVEYKKALKIRPKDVDTLTDYAVACKKQGEAFNKEGKTEEADNQFAKAEKQYKKALEAEPNKVDLLEEYGSFLENQAKNNEAGIQFAKAEAEYKKAVETNPKNVNALKDYRDFFTRRQKYTEAADQCEKLLVLTPRDAEAWYTSGCLYFCNGNFVVAGAKFLNATIMDSKNARYFYWYGKARYAQGNYEDAATQFEKALSLDSKNSKFIFEYGKTFYALGKYQEAIAEFEKVPNSHYFYHAAALAKLGKVEDAKASLNKILDSTDNPKIKDEAGLYLKALNEKGTFEIQV